MTYPEFLASKRRAWQGQGIDADHARLPSPLYDWQAAIVRWALAKGRAALFADTGLGKTFMQLAWAWALQVPTLILAPLCVADQTIAEGARLGIPVRYAKTQAEVVGLITITNYERIEQFDASQFQAVVLDESSILKAFDGMTRTKLIETFRETPYRLCCTATPSPNDITELANHAEFLGLMTRPEFLATWFVRIQEGHRTTTHHGWRMKKHAVDPFYRWMATWAIALRSPADLGYDDRAFRLPPLLIRPELLPSFGPIGDSLFAELGTKGIQGRMAARRTALSDRLATARRLVAPPDQWLLWCGINAESDALARLIPDAVNVEGADSYEVKVSAIQRFKRGEIRVLVTKGKILGFGMNFQHCSHMAFVGLSDSYEMYYQCIRRCWRYGQHQPVSVHVIVSEAERQVVENIRRKEMAALNLADMLLPHSSLHRTQQEVIA